MWHICKQWFKAVAGIGGEFGKGERLVFIGNESLRS
jgi:hypothetical protein